MPIGIITNILSVAIGGMVGTFFKNALSDEMKAGLTNVFAFSSMTMGITLIIKLNNLSAIILSLVLGTIIGCAFHLETIVTKYVEKVSSVLIRTNQPREDYLNTFCAVVVIFCCSGTGLFGALNEGFTGNGSILITKSILDFFTAVIFSAILGNLVAFISVPQGIIYLGLFGISFWILPYVNAEMLADFSAIGGIIAFIAGFRICGIKKDIRIINMLPSLILILPIERLWQLFMK